ncbi:MAG: hypothetical protein A49_21990 [Methyloceanibacter sp.]|nr:MAG: hypothetical protein A49_21990 [Methyloceanibacter sp.]
MGVVTARLFFLAFLALTATIIYNALYLQGHPPHGMADASPSTPVGYATTQVIAVEPQQAGSGNDTPPGTATAYAMPPQSGGAQAPVVTDLPASASIGSESQLVVRAVQRELALRGYDVGAADGQMSEKTRNAIAAFETREGLTVTGIPSDELLRQILLGDSVVTPEATGSVPAEDSIATNAAEHGTVLRVQKILADLGYAPGAIDGAWGENTAQAVSAFQRDRNLAVTGTITPDLLSEFQRVTGREFAKTAVRQ